MKIKRLYRINFFSLQALLVYMFFIKPGVMEDIPILDMIWNAGRFGLTILFLALLLIKTKKLKGTSFPLLIFIVVLFSTFLHGGTYRIILGHWVPIIGIISWLCYHEKKVNEIIKIFLILGEILIILNGFTMLLYPNGFWIRGYETPVWLLGQKQDFVSCYFPTVVLSLIYLKDKKITFFNIFAFVVCLLSIIKAVSLSLVISLIAILILCYFDRIRMVNIRFFYLTSIGLQFAAFFVAFMITKFENVQELLLALPSTGLDKLRTMTGRFQMWQYSLDSLSDNLLLGRGQLTENTWYQTSGLDFYHTIVHNTLLDIALVGGGIALIIFLFWNIITVNKLQRLAFNNKVRCLGIGLIALNVLFITECPYQPLVFSIYGFAYCANFIK